jgi:hypothetical protein
MEIVTLRRIKNDLHFAVPVAQVDEYQATVVATTVDPTANDYRLIDVFHPQFAASMSAQQVKILSENRL